MDETQIHRIRAMEEALDALLSAERALESALDLFDQASGAAEKLESYYGSAAWKRDYADDEQGRLPSGLKRGVLSEDGIYDTLAGYRDLLIRMQHTAAEHLKTKPE